MHHTTLFLVVLAASLLCDITAAEGTTTLVTVLPDSPFFPVDVAVWNAAPADTTSSGTLLSVVYFAHSTADVALAVQLAVASNQSVVARSGRHSYTGLGGIGSYVVVDVSNLSSVEIFPSQSHAEEGDRDADNGPDGGATVATRTPRALVGAGARQYDAQILALQQQLMFPSGTCPTVGVSGFTLGGGYGFFSRKFSVNSDNIISAEVVHVDASAGRVVTRNVSAATDPDLLWALRGGGNNNFGIVTRLELTLHAAPANASHVRLSVHNATVCAAAVQPLYDAIAPYAPQALAIQLVYYSNGCDVVMVYLGPATAAKEASQFEAKWLHIPGVVAGAWVEATATEVVNTFAGCAPILTTPECQAYVNSRNPSPENPSRFGALSVYVDLPLGAAGRQTIFAALKSKPPSLGFAFAEADAYGPSSAINTNCSASDTAFPHRTALYHIQLLVYWAEAALDGVANAWLGAVFQQHLAALGAGSYRNYPNLVLPDALTRFYKGNLARLQRIKQTVDPNNVFRNVQGL